jgi:hypothetical protein
MWIAAAAVVCGVIAFAGLIISGYACLHTPDIHRVPTIGVNRMAEISEQRVTGSPSKAQFLFGPELFLIIFAVVVSYYALSRKKFLERGARRMASTNGSRERDDKLRETHQQLQRR